jgi:SAM-dependent methyltransferase
MPPTMPLSVFRRQPDAAAADAWFDGRAGQAILASEAECLRVALRQRTGQAALWLRPAAAEQACGVDDANLLRLQPDEQGFAGDLRCGLPLPLASESCGLAVVQHLADASAVPEDMLDECARVLLPGGWLWLLALNPLSPYRWRWRGQGLRVCEPVTWRRRLRAVGLVPEPVSQGLGPTWDVAHDPCLQDGAGLRAAFLLRAQKRRLPMTPGRAQRVLRLEAGSA